MREKFHKSLLSMKRNYASLQGLVVIPELQTELKGIKSNVLSDQFWAKLDAILEMVRVITKWITVMETNTPRLSLVPEMLLELGNVLRTKVESSPLSAADKEQFCQKLEDRKSFILGPSGVQFAANILDPHCRGQRLTLEEDLKGCELLASWATDKAQFCRELAAFKTKSGAYGMTYVWHGVCSTDCLPDLLRDHNELPPLTWWLAFFERSVLYPLAERVLSIVATSASVERSFSTQGGIHSKARNRLLGHRVEKLVKISYNRRLEAEGKETQRSFGVTSAVAVGQEEDDDEEEEEKEGEFDDDSEQ